MSTLLAFAAGPLLALLGVLVGHRLTRTSARELDRWRKREETMRLLRWGADIALDDSHGLVGVTVLVALSRAPLLDEDDRELLWSITMAVARHRGRLVHERGRSP